ncbi:hypothetical protein EDD86DRAFT_215474 [Gorgonomyces haynaldii]|nr:hypothetical protein EDD86DRAFT_215474 [Gorgonomyces haynaldii]
MQGATQFSMIDFYDRFVRFYWDLKGPFTHLSRAEIKNECIQLLRKANISGDDCGIIEDNFGGTLWVSKRGLVLINQFILNHRREKAATKIQHQWKKYKASQGQSLGVSEQRKQYLISYIESISTSYYQVLNSNRTSTVKGAGPSPMEVDFMKGLNHPETARVCAEYLQLLERADATPLKTNNRMTMLPGVQDPQNTLVMYKEYSPKVILWMGAVLGMDLDPRADFVSIMRSGDLLCRLAVALYKKVTCHLLDKGPEYGIHKVIFFLEFCKSLHIKRSLLFTVSDLLAWPENDQHKKSGLIVLRTVLTLEKHARKSGWQGPMLNLKTTVNINLGVSTRESMIMPQKQEQVPRDMGHRKSRSFNGQQEMQKAVHLKQPSIEQLRSDTPLSNYSRKNSESDNDGQWVTANASSDNLDAPTTESLTIRDDMLISFVEDEERYTSNLTNVMDYLETLIKKRRRKSARLSHVGSDDFPQNIPSNFKPTASLQQQPGETDVAYKFRLETEIEELGLLFQVIQRMVSLHNSVLDKIKTILAAPPTEHLVGDIVSQFADTLQRAYSTYAVVALSGNNKTSLEVATRGELEKSEFVNQVVGRFIGSKLENEENVQEPTSEEWIWYLQRPVVRLANYRKLLSPIAVHQPTKPIEHDNRKITIAIIKLESTANAIVDSLSMKIL